MRADIAYDDDFGDWLVFVEEADLIEADFPTREEAEGWARSEGYFVD